MFTSPQLTIYANTKKAKNAGAAHNMMKAFIFTTPWMVVKHLRQEKGAIMTTPHEKDIEMIRTFIDDHASSSSNFDMSVREALSRIASVETRYADMVRAIDARMGRSWTAELAYNLGWEPASRTGEKTDE